MRFNSPLSFYILCPFLPIFQSKGVQVVRGCKRSGNFAIYGEKTRNGRKVLSTDNYKRIFSLRPKLPRRNISPAGKSPRRLETVSRGKLPMTCESRFFGVPAGKKARYLTPWSTERSSSAGYNMYLYTFALVETRQTGVYWAGR